MFSFTALDAQTVTFSKERGFYSSSFALTLSSSPSGMTIKYTLDGTPPSASVGTTYSPASPIQINTTTVVRAVAIQGSTVSKVFTHTYIFTNKVILQPANISGWPNNSYDTGPGNDVVHDYQMDPEVVNNSAYSGQMETALKSIPTMSIVMDKNLFWDVYDDEDGELEHPASVELLYANAPSQNEQFNAGLESHSHLRLKRSLKLDLHAPEFISKIFKYAPLNGSTATDDFSGNKIVLRGGNNDCWARGWDPSGATYTRDEFYRSSQAAVSGYASHGTFVHLYINGIYWGMYNPCERPDEGFTSEYLGGSTADWLSVNHDGVREGDDTRYQYLIGSLTNKDMASSSNYNELKQYLNVSAFADYMIVTWMPGVGDWPNNNYYGGNRNTPSPQPFVYLAWDGEWSWSNSNTANEGAWVHPLFESGDNGSGPIAKIWHAARDNSDFMMLFADRVYENCFNGGPMSDNASIERWNTLNNFISTAIIAESARWGDTDDPSEPRTKNDDWTPEVNKIRGLMNGNVNRFITALRAEGYYPNINPPNFNSEGGTVLSGFELTMTNPNGSGTIYYTTNGSDPRTSGGGLLGGAQTYSGPITITGTLTIKARIKNGSEWSALHEGTYTAGYNLKINEFMTNNTNGATDEAGDEEDWIEIFNNSPVPVNVGGLYVTNALSTPKKWQIPTSNATATTIPPFGFLLIWADQESGDGLLHANFKLTQSGGQIGLYAPDGSGTILLDSESYGSQTSNVSRGRLPNGTGAFQSFTTPSPGESNEPGITGLFINEFLASNQTDIVDEFGQHDDWLEIYNNNTTPVNIGGLFITDNLNLPTKYQIPNDNASATTIPAKGFLLLWADEETSQGTLHINIKLGNGGEQLGLVQQSGATIRFIDSLTFGPQTNNISRGRLPNGGPNFTNFTSTTPGASNGGDNVDCNGVIDGAATLDDCGICSGGNTGHIANSDKDACGVCFGTNSTCTPPTCVQNEIVSFTLMKTGTAGEFGPLTNGMVINKAVTGSFSIRANACNGTVGSVKFIVNGSTVRTETAAPYAINGDTPTGSYISWNVNPGTYTLEGKPYSGSGGTGTAGISEIITFTVINQAGGTPDCNGVTGGTAAIDDCGICAGGNTGKAPNANKDCNGVCFGTAVVDDCGVCAGGNTGKVPNADKDVCGVCFGNGSSCGPPPACVPNEIISFTLMKTGTAGEIGPLTNGMVINKAQTGSFSVRANACNGTVGSVKFILNGSTIKTETAAPYAINGDTPTGSYSAWNVNPGTYTLEGKPYTGASGSGTAGVSEIVTFTVIDQQSTTPDCNGVAGGSAIIDDCGVCAGGNTGKIPNANKDCNGVCFGTATPDDCGVCSGGNTGKVPNADKDACGVCFGNGSSCGPPPACVPNEIISFTLMKTGTAGEIGPLTNGMVINKAQIGSFSVRANACNGSVGSVKFILNGNTIKTETAPPYAISGDTPTGNYIAWQINPGTYSLEGKPYTQGGGSGTAGVSEIVTFTVINASSKMDGSEVHAEPTFEFNIYPNPNNGSFSVEAYNQNEADLQMSIYNAIGQKVFTKTENALSGNYSNRLTLNHITPGIYYVEVIWGEQVQRGKMIIE